ncbi:MAG: hypothetical protein GY711_11265 [bacterium]|nr:hypothetical protein [bacterium]
MSKPVQVYILMGQSNMLGFGKVAGLSDACKNKGLYPYLMNEDGSWTVRKDVRYVRVMCSGSGPSKTHNNEWMTIKGNIGPEMGIGHYVGHVTDAPVLILKSCIGNRSLGYDLLPPSAEGYAGDPDPSKRPTSGPWYAGVQYDGDVAAAKKVLAKLRKHYPGAKRYEVAGFFWWQGDKDFRDAEHAANYERNLLCLIESLREDFDAPDARFVCATLGQTREGSGGPQGQILEAQLAIDGKRGKYKDHAGKVATVYSRPLSKGGSSSGHYGGNAETYMNVGQAMGKSMAQMILDGPGGGVPGVKVGELDASLKRAHKHLVAGKLNEAEKVLRRYLDEAGSKDEEQVARARTLDEHLTGLVDGALDEMQDFRDRGDFCGLRDALARTRNSHEGIPAYDQEQEIWTADLATERAVRAIAIGDELIAIVAKKERASTSAYYGLITRFIEKHPDSFYAEKAEAQIAPIQKELRELFDEIEDLENLGDMYSMFELIKEAKRTFAKIPSFDEAHERWSAEAKDPAVRESVAAGEAYADIFADLAELNEQLAKAQAKNDKISSPSKKAKAQERTTASHLKKLEALANKLDKLAGKYGDSYYGRAASASYQAFVDSEGKTLADERER